MMLTSKQFGCLLSAKCFERNYSVTSYGKTQTNYLASPMTASLGVVPLSTGWPRKASEAFVFAWRPKG